MRAQPPADLAPPPPALLDLPDTAAEVLAGFLDLASLRTVVVRICRHALPPLADAFQRHFQLYLHPDAPRNQLLLQLMTSAVTPTTYCQTGGAVATQYVVADTLHVAALLPAALHVRGLSVSSNEYTAWPEHDFQWHTLGRFVALERLSLDHVWERPLDLALLSQCVPQLRELVIKRARCVTNRLGELPRLRLLHLEDAPILSFAIAVGLPSLQELTLMRPSAFIPLEGAARLSDIAPLTKLVTRGTWEALPHEAIGTHHETLCEYSEWGAVRGDPWPTYAHPTWASMTHLRSLRLAGHQQHDLRPFASLVLLEHLQLTVAWACDHCGPLRALSRLRELYLFNGYVCDLVGFLPALETLVWHYAPVAPQHYDDPDLEHVEVCVNWRAECVLVALARLRHLKRLAFQHCQLTRVRHARDRRVTFASAETLEELYVPALGLAGHPASAPLPLWFYDRLPNLRVLASPFAESMPELARLCPRLTHVHLPYSTRCAFWRTRRASLRQLCVVTLAFASDCAWLRRGRQPGGALPALQRIFHPTTDCLSAPASCQRHLLPRGNAPCTYEGFVGDRSLRPAWRYEWADPAEAAERHQLEEYHRPPSGTPSQSA